MFRTIAATAPAVILAAQPAFGSSQIAIRSAVFVEQEEADAGRSVEPAAILSRGQRVVTVLNWKAPPRTSSFTVTTPVPPTLSFERTSSGREEISVDGGRSWGRLGQLRKRDTRGWRLAVPEDITHLRWRVPGNAPSGRLTYSAWVR